MEVEVLPRTAKRTLGRVFRGHGREAAVQAGLVALLGELTSRDWRREDGAILPMERLFVDARYLPDQVYAAIRRSATAPVVMPAQGWSIRAGDRDFSEYKRRPGERYGWHWRIPRPADRRAMRSVHVDTNHWKSFVQARLAVPMGDPGSLSLFGRKGEDHRMLAEHLTAETRTRTEGRGRKVDDWKHPPGAQNHWGDGLVGCAAAASMCGCTLPGIADRRGGSRKRVDFAELQQRARGA